MILWLLIVLILNLLKSLLMLKKNVLLKLLVYKEMYNDKDVIVNEDGKIVLDY